MAATQIHGDRQILDGTIKGTKIANNAAIHNSKLDLSSISQSVILRHANGVLIEPGGGSDEGQIRIRRNVVANPATSLFRLIVPAATDELTVERNTAAGGDFGTKVTHMSFRDDRILMAVPTLRLENVETSLQFRETDRALPGGLWRVIANGGDLRIDLNTALAGDFSTFATPLQITSGPDVQVNDRLLLSGSQAQIRFIQEATIGILNTSLRLSSGRLVWRDGVGVDQTLAYLSEISGGGLGGSGTTNRLAKFTGATSLGDSTLTDDGAEVKSTLSLRLESLNPGLLLRETDQAIDGGGLWRIRLESTSVKIEFNTAVAGDFSTVSPNAVTISNGTIDLGNNSLQALNNISLFDEISVRKVLVTPAITPSGADANNLFRQGSGASGQSRLHWKDNTNATQMVAFIEDYRSKETPTGAVDGINTAFTLAATPVNNSEEVYLNGLLQSRVDDYTITGATITFVSPPQSGDKILVSYFKTNSQV